MRSLKSIFLILLLPIYLLACGSDEKGGSSGAPQLPTGSILTYMEANQNYVRGTWKINCKYDDGYYLSMQWTLASGTHMSIEMQKFSDANCSTVVDIISATGLYVVGNPISPTGESRPVDFQWTQSNVSGTENNTSETSFALIRVSGNQLTFSETVDEREFRPTDFSSVKIILTRL